MDSSCRGPDDDNNESVGMLITDMFHLFVSESSSTLIIFPKRVSLILGDSHITKIIELV